MRIHRESLPSLVTSVSPFFLDALKAISYHSGMEDLTGQLLMAGFNGTSVNAHLESLIVDEGIGGIILFSRNIESAEQLTRLIAELQSISARRNPELKLLVSVDQEGGRVCRLPPPFRRYPSYRYFTTEGTEKTLRENSESLAEELVGCGFNMNMAPVLDVDTNPENPVIGDRSFSPEPDIVARSGRAVMESFLKKGLIPVGKHFPGHGDTSADSHTSLPVVQKSISDLERTELVPFRAAVSAGIQAIMTAHILYPKVDPKFPATVSGIILKNLLRDSMNYHGVIISDDLEMKGISEKLSVSDIVSAGINATLDIFLCCHTEDLQRDYLSEIRRSYRKDSFLKERISASIKRVISLKRKLQK